MDKVQKIREEVEKLKSSLIHGACSSQIVMETICKEEAYNEVLSILNSLQEEPSKFDAAIQEGDDVRYNEDLGCRVNLSQLKRVAKKEEPVSKNYRERYKRIAQSEKFKKTYEGMSVGEIMHVEGEEPVSKELEEACEQLAENARKHKAETSSPFFSQTDYKQGVIDGANWQREKDESTTEDLGKYINELSKQFPEVSFAKLSRIAVRVAKWKEEQDKKKEL